MKKILAMCLSICFILVPVLAQSPTTALHRWYNSESGDHFYTTDETGEFAPDSGYVYEGITGYIGTSSIEGTTALYRWYNTESGDHGMKMLPTRRRPWPHCIPISPVNVLQTAVLPLNSVGR